ncbi:MAG: hypothetical protein ACRED4_02365, partial [Brevundimonas sp.]
CSCSVRDETKPERQYLFSGDLASIDGQSIRAGVSIEIWSAPGSDQPASYQIKTGCRLSGLSDDGQQFTGGETLSPCSEAEVGAITQLSRILSGRSNLVLTRGETAEFRSPDGIVRFEHIQ